MRLKTTAIISVFNHHAGTASVKGNLKLVANIDCLIQGLQY